MTRLAVKRISKSYPRSQGGWRLFWNALVNSGVVAGSEVVLKDISFTVAPGESLAILGRNGAGKSTLLRILTRTTLPSSGTVTSNGRITALIELGLGMNPELTGRENARIGCQIQGLNDPLEQLVSEIHSFSELENWFDRPVRLYSTGMQMRLAFSIAIVRQPDILIVDEAFAVGDLHFQHKSTEIIQRYRASGTSLLLVSHDIAAVKRLCDRALLLEDGCLLKEGSVVDVADYYFAMVTQQEEQSRITVEETEQGLKRTHSGTGEVVLDKVRLLNSEGREVDSVASGEELIIALEATAQGDEIYPCVGFMLRDRLGTEVFGYNTERIGMVSKEPLSRGQRLELRFSFRANLGRGSYNVALAVHDERNPAKRYVWSEKQLVFRVTQDDNFQFEGLNRLPVSVTCERFEPARISVQ
jgi:lipopolysaccharide transport system ATP-binding protein